MPYPIYTIEQLLRLRQSPLITVPPSLKSIEEWLGPIHAGSSNVSATSNRTARRKDGGQQQEVYSPMGEARQLAYAKTPSFGARDEHHLTAEVGLAGRGLRPPTKRINSENMTLGPPRSQFTSSRSRGRLLDQDPKENDDLTSTSPPQDGAGFGGMDIFSDPLRGRVNQHGYDSLHEPREAKFSENWRSGPHLKDRFEGRIPRREIEQQLDWRSGAGPAEGRSSGRAGDRDPEWMSGGLEEPDGDAFEPGPHTAEEFERWRTKMRAGERKQLGEPEEPEPGTQSSATEDRVELTLQAKTATSRLDLSKLDLGGKDMLDPWDPDSSDTVKGPGIPPAKDRRAKGSRFAAMFSNQQSAPEPSTAPNPAASLAEQLSAYPVPSSAEDQKAFQRVLQMLGGGGSVPALMPAAQQPTPAEAPPDPSKPSHPVWSPTHLFPDIPESGPLSAAMQRSQAEADHPRRETTRGPALPSDRNTAFLLSLMAAPRHAAESGLEEKAGPPSPARARKATNQGPRGGFDSLYNGGKSEPRSEMNELNGDTDAGRRTGPPGLGQPKRSEFEHQVPFDLLNPDSRPATWQPDVLMGRRQVGPPAGGPQVKVGLNGGGPAPLGHQGGGMPEKGYPQDHPFSTFGGLSPPGMPPHPINHGPQGMNPPLAHTSNLAQILSQGANPANQPPSQHWSTGSGPPNMMHHNPSFRNIPNKPGPPPGLLHNTNLSTIAAHSHSQLNSPLGPNAPPPPSLGQHNSSQAQPFLDQQGAFFGRPDHQAQPASRPQPLQHSDPPRPMPYRQEQQLRQQMTQPPPPTHPRNDHFYQSQPHHPQHPHAHPGVLPPGPKPYNGVNWLMGPPPNHGLGQTPGQGRPGNGPGPGFHMQ